MERIERDTQTSLYCSYCACFITGYCPECERRTGQKVLVEAARRQVEV